MDKKVLLWAKNEKLSSAEPIGVRERCIYKAFGNSTQALVHNTVDPCELWHRRFGYLHYTTLPSLQKMVTGMPEFFIKQDGVCKGCTLGKGTKKSFSRSKNSSKRILDLIHSDICGPMY